MKKFAKILALALAVLLTTVALADSGLKIDLSGMTFDELVSLKDSINLAIWNSAEWQEVKVPQGVWEVGKDIPAGYWTVKCSPHSDFVQVSWGDTLNETADGIGYSDRVSAWNTIYNKDKYNDEDDEDRMFEYSLNVREGDYIVIAFGSVIFMPYSGKAPFTFK